MRFAMHLMMNGFKPGYTVWTSHGEVESDTMFNNFVVGESSRSTEHNYFQGSRMSDMINDAFGMHSDFEQGENIQSLSIFNQPGKGSKKRTLHKLTEKEKKSAELHVLLNCPEVQPFLDYFVSQYGHDQVFPSFITWYTNWVSVVIYTPIKRLVIDHILEEVNKEELDMPTNMEGDEEETFEEDEWIDEEETSEDDACEWIDDEETSEEDE
ncbi:hypothetical protein H5410_004941 [Solanum commersonii]|uniref:Transposase-associated domain-containing protein n=1 Tax=Solanum commersonii TaxID=4109 RepID=A0A9J6A608_SOLCO|nr:hypothetical protein H5410_004941 [Solanum commersonii]